MPWYFPWGDSIKKKACRYLLQHYVGSFLQEKLSIDQLSIDIYNGTGKIEDVSVDVCVSTTTFSYFGFKRIFSAAIYSYQHVPPPHHFMVIQVFQLFVSFFVGLMPEERSMLLMVSITVTLFVCLNILCSFLIFTFFRFIQ